MAYFISDTVDALNLSAFYARYAGGGSRNQPFHPAMMVKVLVYAYATGVFSSRKIERRLHEDLALRMLAVGNFPRHRTICDFRAFHAASHAAASDPAAHGHHVSSVAACRAANESPGAVGSNLSAANFCRADS